MSKAILVVDIEECCADCPCSLIDDKGMVICLAMRGEEVGKDGIKPDWCPLKELPKEDNESYFPDEYSDGYANGWNACINEILGKRR